MKDYEAKDDWQLYLWKQNEDFVGIMGIVKRESSFGNSAFECEPISPSYGYWDEDGSRVKRVNFLNLQFVEMSKQQVFAKVYRA